MKVTIDTTNKTIEIEDWIKLDDFIKQISDIIPNWKEYTLKPKVINNNWGWPYTFGGTTTPITIPHPHFDTTPYSPYVGDPLPGQNPINISGIAGTITTKVSPYNINNIHNAGNSNTLNKN